MNLHEWGDEKDCFTKEDLTTLCVSFFNHHSCHSFVLGNIRSKIRKVFRAPLRKVTVRCPDQMRAWSKMMYRNFAACRGVGL